eukprot:2013558-Amphidinium_carterae.2
MPPRNPLAERNVPEVATQATYHGMGLSSHAEASELRIKQVLRNHQCTKIHLPVAELLHVQCSFRLLTSPCSGGE